MASTWFAKARTVLGLDGGASRTRRFAALGVAAAVGVGCVVVASVGLRAAVAGDNELVGTPIDAVDAQNMTLAALSCPALTGPRLAAQLLADGAPTAGTFQKWAPWPSAAPTDTRATYYAVAHDLCDLVGQVRSAGVGGDAWHNALAAHHSGLAAVKSAKHVPAPDQSYVDTVDGYATWYAKQSYFGGPRAAPSAEPSTAFRLAADGVSPVQGAFVAVPAEEVAAVNTAGNLCPQVTPARVAAQLMVSSGFNPNLRAATGQQGVAQFSTDLWATYASSSKSPYDPAAAVPALGSAMCGLVTQLSQLGGDPYQLALAAFRVGPTAVRQAMGVPSLPGVHAFVDDVLSDSDHYTQDQRLAVRTAPSPTPTTAAPTKSPSAAPKTPSAAPTPTKSPVPQLYKIVSVNSGKFLSPLDHRTDVNSVIVQHGDTNTRDQLWQLVPMGDGRVRVKNAGNGLSIAVFAASMQPEAVIVQASDDINTDHEWVFNDQGGGVYKVQNVLTGLLLAVDHMSQQDNANVTQYGDNGTADHLWRLVPAS